MKTGPFQSKKDSQILNVYFIILNADVIHIDG